MSKKRNKFAAAMVASAAMAVATLLSGCGTNAEKAEALYRTAQEASLDDQIPNNDKIRVCFEQARENLDKTQKQETKEKNVTKDSCDALTAFYGTGFTYWYDKSRDNANTIINLIESGRASSNERDLQLLYISLAEFFNNYEEAKKWQQKIELSSKSTENSDIQSAILKSMEQMEGLETKKQDLTKTVVVFFDIAPDKIEEFAAQIPIDEIIKDEELAGVLEENGTVSFGEKLKTGLEGFKNYVKAKVSDLYTDATTSIDVAGSKLTLRTGNEKEKEWAKNRLQEEEPEQGN